MKILFDHPEPALLVHGGMEIQIRQTKMALDGLGCAVEHLRWWDETQTGDIIHFFGRISPHLVEFAQRKGIRVVMSELLAVQGSRSNARLWRQRLVMRLLAKILPAQILVPLRWRSYQMVDACVALTPWEAHLMQYLFGARPDRVHVVPNGVEAAFRDSAPATRGPWLVCTATITERKRVVELALAAAAARTPLWVIGEPYSEEDSYARRFREVVKANPEILRYSGGVRDRSALAKIYREARGFALWSSSESLSLSALEAAACECPLLLSDLPWARTVFKETASYCPVAASTEVTAPILKNFYDGAPSLPIPPKPLSWPEVAGQLKTVYERVLKPNVRV